MPTRMRPPTSSARFAKRSPSWQLRSTVDADGLASVFVATLEGAMMLTNLYKDGTRMAQAITHLREFVDSSVHA
jgi:hypothetical protein